MEDQQDQRGTRARKLFSVYAAAMKGRVNTCVNKSLVQALESCPSSDTTPPAVLPNFVHSRENSKSAGIATANMDSQKLDAMLREPRSYYDSVSVPKWPQKQSQSI